MTISTTTGGASIRYTLDGTDPTPAVGTLYSGPVSIDANCTLKAIAYRADMVDSALASGAYTIQVATPTFNPAPGTFGASQAVAISTTTSGASIRYTLDGTTPSPATGILYTAPIDIGINSTLKAIAYRADMVDSAVASGTYTIRVATPTFSPAPGTYNNPIAVTLNCITEGADIYYTLDGTNPSPTHGTHYSGPFTIGFSQPNRTVKAMASKSAMADSAIGSSTYTFVPDAPTFNPGPGTYAAPRSVAITSATTVGYIRYTTDGTTPSASHGTTYSGPVILGSSCTLKAMVRAGQADSAVTSGDYLLVVAPPALSPPPGTYVGTRTVAISCATPGATIRYTLDGSDPAGGPVYSTPVAIDHSCTLKAIATKSGLGDSPVTSGDYTIRAATPSFEPAAGAYLSEQSVTISTTTPGASINYTLDGTDPSATVGTPYTAPILVSTNTTLKAVACRADLAESEIVSAAYVIQAAAPAFSPAAGGYGGPQSITISCSTAGASIYYTLDGTDPTAGSSLYTSPVSVDHNCTLKSVACAPGMGDSPITSSDYTVQAATPTFDPVPGAYGTPQSVVISTATSGAGIRYTLDGTDPSSTVGTLYVGPVVVNGNCTLKAVVYRSDMEESGITSGEYIVAVDAPTFSPSPGAYPEAQLVTITCATPEAVIRYTLDGSDPSGGAIYSGPVAVDRNCTLKAVAGKSAMADSPITSGDYTIQAAAPSFDPVPGTYLSEQAVTISTTTVGASVNYTLDGSDPSSTVGTLYTAPVAISANATLKAIAYRPDLADSAITSGDYVIQQRVAQPVFDPVPGTYSGAQSVSITCSTAGATIYYTLNGTDPTTGSTPYAAAVLIDHDCTLKAIAAAPGMEDSPIAAGTYTIEVTQAAAPTFDPGPGTYVGQVYVTMSTTTAGASIRYTTNGTTPTASYGFLYSNPVFLSAHATIKAIAYRSDLAESAITGGEFAIQVPTPIITSSRFFVGSLTLFMSCSLQGATIRYTTDGTDPNPGQPGDTSLIYNPSARPIVTATTTVKAKAYRLGWVDSAIATATYTLNHPPVVSPASVQTQEDIMVTWHLSAEDVDGQSLSFELGSQAPTKGTVYDSGTGSYTYVPTSDSYGSDQFTLKAWDGLEYSAEQTVSVTITQATITLTPASLSLSRGESKQVTVTAEPTVATDRVTLTADDPSLVTISGSGTSYTITAGETSGSTTVHANKGGESRASLAVTVVANHAPTVQPGSLTVELDQPSASGTLQGSDADNDPFTFSIATPPALGDVQLDASTGAYTYTPHDDVHGTKTDTFTFTAQDQEATSAPGTVTVTIHRQAMPEVSITEPVADAFYGRDAGGPMNILMQAQASLADGAIERVEFYQGATLTGTVYSAPYAFTWTNVADGAYTLTARAYGDLGRMTTSDPVSIVVRTLSRGRLDPTRLKIANTHDDFSSVQGGNGWSYAFTHYCWLFPYDTLWDTFFELKVPGGWGIRMCEWDGSKWRDPLDLPPDASGHDLEITSTWMRTTMWGRREGVETLNDHLEPIQNWDSPYTYTEDAYLELTAYRCPDTSLREQYVDVYLNGYALLDYDALRDPITGRLPSPHAHCYPITSFDPPAQPMEFPLGHITKGTPVAVMLADEGWVEGGDSYVEAEIVLGPRQEPPTVTLTGVVGGARFLPGNPIQLVANVGGSASIDRVGFYANGVLIGTDSSGPDYTFTWTDAAPGSYHIEVKVWTIDGVVTTATAVTVTVLPPGVSIAHCPAYFVPGHENVVSYVIAANPEYTAGYGKIEIFQRAETGQPVGPPLFTSTDFDLTGGAEHPFVYSGTEAGYDPGKYLFRLSAGNSEQDAVTAEAAFDVKAWDLLVFLVDALTDEEKQAFDEMDSEAPTDYLDIWDPYLGDETGELTYCSGVNADTVTPTGVAVAVWCWDGDESSAESLTINNGLSTAGISDADWQDYWGLSVAEKPWFDERGASLVDLNGLFYSMSEPGQLFFVRVAVAEDGALDNAGNPYDADPQTEERESTVVYTLSIDKDGAVNILNVEYRP